MGKVVHRALVERHWRSDWWFDNYRRFNHDWWFDYHWWCYGWFNYDWWWRSWWDGYRRGSHKVVVIAAITAGTQHHCKGQ
jgi:hypothetical protein